MERLGVDHVDLLWVHMHDRLTPVEETVRALDDVVRSGKVHYIGISDAPAWVVSRANTMADLRGWTRFNALQIRYSLVDRTPERDLLPMARALDLAVTPWAILGAGVLTGKYTSDGGTDGNERLVVEPERGRVALTERNLAIARTVDEVAAEAGCTPSQAAIAWMRDRPGVVVPILGARTQSQVEDNLGALDVSLSADHLARLDEASAIEPGFPHDFLESDFVRNLMYSGQWDSIDEHRPH
jgi:aryl-alcohol dehydrogenase-like predicted oxidoreductase